MGLRDWWRGRGANIEDPRLRRWREDWSKTAGAAESGDIARMGAELDAFGLPEEEIEIEREMLQALRERDALLSSVRESGLPRVETGHRVVRAEPCHYSAPVSMPDEPGQPSGRLLLTSGRAIFAGGGSGLATAWHMISAALHMERDVVLVRNGREQVYRFRCNTYGDALRGAFIAGHLLAARRRSPPGL
jgi:hypothetical protein